MSKMKSEAMIRLSNLINALDPQQPSIYAWAYVREDGSGYLEWKQWQSIPDGIMEIPLYAGEPT